MVSWFSFLFQVSICIVVMKTITSYCTRLKSIPSSRNYSNGARSLRLYRMGVSGNDNTQVTAHSLKSSASGKIARSLFLSTSAFFGPSVSRVLASASSTSALSGLDTSADVTIATPYTKSLTEEVKKRGNDKRSYSAFALPNGMRVLVVSDPQSVNAAAAVDVHVGSFSDPVDIPGLAHFCEHMVRARM